MQIFILNTLALSIVNEHSEYFRNSINNLLPVSMECLDTDSTKDNLVKQVAILNCGDKKWSSFLCILGLSSFYVEIYILITPDAGADIDINCFLIG
jgi:hypothetical protein